MKRGLIALFVMYSVAASSQPCLEIPDTICTGTTLFLDNQCQFSSQYWNFCGGSMDFTPYVKNLGTLSYMSSPVRIAVALDNGVYYAFWTNFGSTSQIVKCVFGNSLRNTPQVFDLGNISGVFTNLNEGIQLIKDNNTWYGFMVGSGNKLIRINFGSSLNNTPTATSLGVIGSMSMPHGLYIFKENNVWTGLTANAYSNTITRFTFTGGLGSVPVAEVSGTIAGADYITSVFPIRQNDTCYALVTSAHTNEIYRLNYGNSYQNNFTVTNLGNIGALNEPFDIAVMTDCNQSYAIISNKYHVAGVSLTGGVAGPMDGDTISSGIYNRNEGISNAIRQNDTLYYLIANAGNRLSLIGFGSCSSASPQNYSGSGVTGVMYQNPGTYQISLQVNEGMFNQSAECSPLVVISQPNPPVLTDLNDTVFAQATGTIQWYIDNQPLVGYSEDYLVPTCSAQIHAVVSNGYCNSVSSNTVNFVYHSVEDEFAGLDSWTVVYHKGLLEISSDKQTSETAELEITDLAGKTIWKSGEIENGKHSFPLNDLRSGIYLYRIGSKNGIQKGKLLIGE